MKRVNKVKNALRNNKMAFGTGGQIASPEVVEIIGSQGLDFIWIDMEHGHFGVDSLPSLVRASETYGMAPIVRVLYNEPSLIMQVLDIGAMGVIVPGISSKADAEKAIHAGKYHPAGMRGSCPWTRAAGYNISSGEWGEFIKWSNEETMVWLLVEGKEGVDNFDEIISVPNVDVVLLGAFDLSQSLGIPGQIDHPMVKEAFKRMVDKATEKGITLGTVMIADTSNPEAITRGVEEWASVGGKILTIGGDRPILSDAYKMVLENAIRGIK